MIFYEDVPFLENVPGTDLIFQKVCDSKMHHNGGCPGPEVPGSSAASVLLRCQERSLPFLRAKQRVVLPICWLASTRLTNIESNFLEEADIFIEIKWIPFTYSGRLASTYKETEGGMTVSHRYHLPSLHCLSAPTKTFIRHLFPRIYHKIFYFRR